MRTSLPGEAASGSFEIEAGHVRNHESDFRDLPGTRLHDVKEIELRIGPGDPIDLGEDPFALGRAVPARSGSVQS